ncbi:hypothetical protein YH65_05190 [Sulfurovum lithotrophicum]|uniref:Lipoprotein n=1 Tax=Sulfurovum lithotrophicum TaxID=206403 RepID=A0A7U4M102_9BACT|nr:hypothetical protein [Sulfurovum lithotrophicum]AKF24849.1 hypothetical protein YH65_05190 [Sulfurovum lithotrophicum]
MHRETVMAFCLFSLLLGGCSSKEEKALLQVYNKEKVYYKKLLHTEKAQLYDANETKVLLTATYLYSQTDVPKEKDKRDEVFIIGLYMEDEEVARFTAGDFNLTLNGETPKSVKILKKADKRLKNIPFITDWGDYFEVVFPYTLSMKFDLVFNSETYGVKKLHFAKKAKYVFTKEAF